MLVPFFESKRSVLTFACATFLAAAAAGCMSVRASDGLMYPGGVDAAKASAAHDLGCAADSLQATTAGSGESTVYVVDGCGARSTYQYKELQTFHAGNRGEVILLSRMTTGAAPPPPPAPAPSAPLVKAGPVVAASPAAAADGCSKDYDCKGTRVCVQRQCVPPPPTVPCRVDAPDAGGGG